MIRKAYRDSLIMGSEKMIRYSFEVNILSCFLDNLLTGLRLKG